MFYAIKVHADSYASAIKRIAKLSRIMEKLSESELSFIDICQIDIDIVYLIYNSRLTIDSKETILRHCRKQTNINDVREAIKLYG
jgi:hypothetical protein